MNFMNFLTTTYQKTNLKTKYITLLLNNGNKNKIENLFLKTIKEIQKSTKKQYLSIIKLSIINNYTVLLLKNSKNKKFKQKNVKKIMIPFLLKKQNRITTALNTIILLSKKTANKSFFISLKLEILSLLELKKQNSLKEELYKLIFLKKNFAHFRWFI